MYGLFNFIWLILWKMQVDRAYIECLDRMGWFISPVYVTYNQLIFMFFRRVRHFLPNDAISRGHHPNRHSHDSKHRFLIHSGQTSTKISTTYQMMNEILHPVVGTDGWNPRPFRCSSAFSPGLSAVPTPGGSAPLADTAFTAAFWWKKCTPKSFQCYRHLVKSLPAGAVDRFSPFSAATNTCGCFFLVLHRFTPAMILLGGVSRMVDGCKLAPVTGAWQTLARRVTHFRKLHLAQCHGTNFPVGPQGLDYVDDTMFQWLLHGKENEKSGHPRMANSSWSKPWGCLRKIQQTPGTDPRYHKRDFLHEQVGFSGLGYVPGVCWSLRG